MAGIESLLIGRLLGGRYRIEEVIGRGGMGVVYRAVDERLGRQVALKVITVATAGEGEARERLRARFFREARSAAALPHHPNVVPVYDFGSDEELGLDYLVMELLRGSDLATRLAGTGAPPLSGSLKILIEAGRGLAVGHAQGLIHRDVKPGNIFLARTHSGVVQVRVVDFGIAKVADDEDTAAQLTQDGRVPHSPAYASPEQLRGLTNLTPAADVFGLGTVGFQLLTGERPFNEHDRNRMSLGIPVEVPSLRAANPAVPAAVEAVIQRALAFDPASRYPDAGSFVDDLETSIRAIADSPIDPYLTGAAVISAADADDRTVIAPVGDGEHTLLAPAAGDDHTLVAPPHQRERPVAPVVRPRPAAPAAASQRTPLPPRPPLRRESRLGIGGMIVWGVVVLSLLAAGLWGWDNLRGGRELPPSLVTDSIPADTIDIAAREARAQAYALSQAGYTAYVANPPRYGEALGLFQRAVDLDPENWHYRRNYGMTLSQVGDFLSAIHEIQRAIEIDPTLPLAYASLGSVHLARGDTANAIAAFEQYVERETDPVERARFEGLIRELDQPDLPLLGEPIPGDRQGETPTTGLPTTPPVPPVPPAPNAP